MVLCDTNILINAFNGNLDTIQDLKNIGYTDILLSAVTVMELYKAWATKTNWLK